MPDEDDVADAYWAESLFAEVSKFVEGGKPGIRWGYECVGTGEWVIQMQPPLMQKDGGPVFDPLHVMSVGRLLKLFRGLDRVVCNAAALALRGTYRKRKVTLAIYFTPLKGTEISGKVLQNGASVEFEEVVTPAVADMLRLLSGG